MPQVGMYHPTEAFVHVPYDGFTISGSKGIPTIRSLSSCLSSPTLLFNVHYNSYSIFILWHFMIDCADSTVCFWIYFKGTIG